MESIIFKLAICKLSIFYLVSVAEHIGLSHTCSDLPKTGFVAARPINKIVVLALINEPACDLGTYPIGHEKPVLP